MWKGAPLAKSLAFAQNVVWPAVRGVVERRKEALPGTGKPLVHLMGPIERRDPRMDAFPVVSRRDEVPRVGVEPVTGVGMMSGRQDGRAVLQRQADDASLATRRLLEGIAQRTNQQP